MIALMHSSIDAIASRSDPRSAYTLNIDEDEQVEGSTKMKKMPSELSEPSEPSEISEPFMEETQRTPEEAPRDDHDLRRWG